ncbi:UNVERIFIED_CONTAM: hypothetical protein K2H54_055794 [Gekko kuhli]
MASREEDGFLSLQEPETTGGTGAAEEKRGTEKRPAAATSEGREGPTAAKRAKKARAPKQAGLNAAAIAERKRRKFKDGNGQHGKNPHKESPDATGYSRAERSSHEFLQVKSETAESAEGRNATAIPAADPISPEAMAFFRKAMREEIQRFCNDESRSFDQARASPSPSPPPSPREHRPTWPTKAAKKRFPQEQSRLHYNRGRGRRLKKRRRKKV